MLLNPDANPVQQLSRYIYKEGPRNQAMPYKIVEIYLPLDILKVSLSQLKSIISIYYSTSSGIRKAVASIEIRGILAQGTVI